MQKSAPSIGRILIAIGFTLSCFGLLLFLWVAFGGPVPLKSKSYRVDAYFPEAIQLAVESDVRIGGVSVGKVKEIDLAPIDVRSENGQDLTRAVLEIEPEFAPINSDSRAMLRQKTLLGETYVELTSGTREEDAGVPVSLGAAANVTDAELAAAEPIPEGGELPVGQTRDQVQIDEIFNALDEETRVSFQRWQQNAAVAIQNRGRDLNDSFGNLGPFLSDASDVLALLRRQREELRGIVRDGGEVFDALSERGEQLAGAITNSNETFEALASEDEALREIFQILPTFQREARLTFNRLDAFQENTLPLVLDLQPVADDVTPTLRSVRRLSPNLESLFEDLPALIRASRTGFPALERFLDELSPVLEALDPFLANLNPVISYLEFHKTTVTDFLASPPAALSGTIQPRRGQPSAGHTLRQLGYVDQETLSMYERRLPTNRGNAYIRPYDRIFNEGRAARLWGFPSFDCRNTGDGQRLPGDGGDPPVGIDFASCFLPRDYPGEFGGGRAPQVTAEPAGRVRGGGGGGGGDRTGGGTTRGGGGSGGGGSETAARDRSDAGGPSQAVTASAEDSGALPFSGLPLLLLLLIALALSAAGWTLRRLTRSS